VPVVDEGMELYGKLRNEITKNREDFRGQVRQIKDAIEIKTQELDLLNTKKLKLEGAIEAADIFLKLALPSNNPK
jgi:hypothetical protein